MGDDKGEEKPKGGVDHSTLSPQSGTTYTVRITFHAANNLPIADLGRGASDPFVLAQAFAHVPTRHKKDPPVRFRSATAQRTINPKWEAQWVLGGVPEHGMRIKARVYDEDTGTHDDRLGKAHIHTGPLKEGYHMNHNTMELQKRGADIRAWGLKSCMSIVSHEARKDATITVSIEVLCKTEDEVGKLYTMNNFWWIHYAPVMGKLMGTTAPDEDGAEAAK